MRLHRHLTGEETEVGRQGTCPRPRSTRGSRSPSSRVPPALAPCSMSKAHAGRTPGGDCRTVTDLVSPASWTWAAGSRAPLRASGQPVRGQRSAGAGRPGGCRPSAAHRLGCRGPRWAALASRSPDGSSGSLLSAHTRLPVPGDMSSGSGTEWGSARGHQCGSPGPRTMTLGKSLSPSEPQLPHHEMGVNSSGPRRLNWTWTVAGDSMPPALPDPRQSWGPRGSGSPSQKEGEGRRA